MKIFLIAITVISSLLMVAVILLQQGKGANLGSAFGSGAQGGLVGEQGRANFLTRTTSVLVTIFFLACLTLSLFLGSTRDDPVRELLQDGGAPAIEQSANENAGDDVDNNNATVTGDNDNANTNANDNNATGADDERPLARE